ncbi:MAG: 2'-5' RNA ligase family protein [Acidobacteria bacterium]|nr:2'-5' RNA ligase family protein [Acidobacteriota bacterium]
MTHAIWLIPDDESLASISRLVARCSRFFGTAPLKPHLTLLSRLGITDEKVLQLKAERLATKLTPFEMQVLGLGFRAYMYQAFYVQLEPNAGFQSARERALQAYDVPERQSFPHISLAYGDMPDDAKREFQPVIEPDLPEFIRFDRLQLVRLQDPYPEWRVLWEKNLKRTP